MPCLATSDRYSIQLPAGHRFPIAKYALIREQLLWQGIAPPEDFYDPGLCAEEDILRLRGNGIGCGVLRTEVEYWVSVRRVCEIERWMGMRGLALLTDIHK